MKKILTVIAVLILAFFLRIYKLSELMPFIGDYGWFYLSARNMLLTGQVPLVGITSSHTWLHQGPFWTYILAGALFLFKFNPISGGYIAAFFGIASTLLIYKVCLDMFSKRVGLIAALLYASSPLVVIHDRIPYHTSPISFFVLLFIFFLHRWTLGQKYFFPLILFGLAILYNFELATQVFWFVLLGVIVYGIWKKEKYVNTFKYPRILLFSCIAYFIPLIPVVLYDIAHGFPQTLKFFLWIPYKIVTFVPSFNFIDMVWFYSFYYKRLIFPSNGLVALLIAAMTFGWFFQKRGLKTNYVVIFFCFVVPFLGFFIHKTPSEAYTPIFFSTVILIVALYFDHLIKANFKPLAYSVIGLIVISNTYYLFSHNFFIDVRDGYGTSFVKRIRIAKQIIVKADGKKYNLRGIGQGQQHASYVMGYEYLTWWLGNGPLKEKQNTQFAILNPDTHPVLRTISQK